MKLSVITVCKNQPFIRDTCESIAAQSAQNFQWIVVDGGSTDGTLDVLNMYNRRIDNFITEPDGGIYQAMNKGIRASSGEFLIFMNGGDFFFSNDSIKKSLLCIDESADVFYGDSYRKFDNPEKDFIKTYPDTITFDFFLANTLGHQSCFIRKDLFDRFGMYREDFKIVSDKEKWLVFMENNVRFKKIPFCVSVYRMNGISQNKTPELAAEKRRMFSGHGLFF
ncbi:MAG: glycosyltransferase [Rickettsiales bacterium]|jgi:glycosyltransferase involved in cell wall biosynthesis|nr:glycosyltransferase [Rickettsiales bacterium]